MRKCNTYLILYLDPLPCIPNHQDIEHKSYKDQKFVISGWVGGQSDEIENKKDNGDDGKDSSYCFQNRIVLIACSIWEWAKHTRNAGTESQMLAICKPAPRSPMLHSGGNPSETAHQHGELARG